MSDKKGHVAGTRTVGFAHDADDFHQTDLLVAASALGGGEPTTDRQVLRGILLALIDIAESQRRRADTSQSMKEQQEKAYEEDDERLERDAQLRREEFEETKRQNEIVNKAMKFNSRATAHLAGITTPEQDDAISRLDQLSQEDGPCRKCGVLKSLHLFLSVDDQPCEIR
jgi:hypothetical protein